jgi:hypothetical protein
MSQEEIMTWQSQVASWVIPLLGDFVIPDDATVITGIEFATLDDAQGSQTLSGEILTAEYPGLIPDYSTDFEINPQTNGVQYNLKALKAVGFYGVLAEVVSYNDKRLNKWTFPLLRRNFGFLSLSRGIAVASDHPLHYGSQYHFNDSVQSLALNYDDDFAINDLTNNVDKYCLNRVDAFLYPEVVLRVSFLPIWEVWAVRFFQLPDD